MASPVSTVSCVANVFIRQMVFKDAGDVEPGHCHVFDHQTLLARGALKAVVNGKESVFLAPQIIFIKAGVLHEFTALEPNTTAFCIHALRDGDGAGDIIDPAGLPQGVTGPELLDLAKPLVHRPTEPAV